MNTDRSQILIVEDEKELNNLIAEAVRLAGYEPYQCFNGKSAFEAIANKLCEPKLVICDINMEEMSGIELIKELMMNDINLNFCIISANGRTEDFLEAIRLGVTDYMVKPVRLHKLVGKLNSLVEIGKRQTVVDFQTKSNQETSLAKKMENLLRLKNSTYKKAA